MYQTILHFQSIGREIKNITPSINKVVETSGYVRGLCHLFIQHTSASLIICENADPIVKKDLEKFFHRLVPDGDSIYEHDLEGIDDMPAHIRTVLTESSLVIPVINNKLGLGTWQGIYLWEHRLQAHKRTIVVTLYGDTQ